MGVGLIFVIIEILFFDFVGEVEMLMLFLCWVSVWEFMRVFYILIVVFFRFR